MSFERWLLCPADRAAFSFLLFWPPPAGARRGRLWGCAPFSAPLASPPKHPAGLVVSFHSTDEPSRAFHISSSHEGCAAVAAGASSLRSAISLRAAQCQRASTRCMGDRRRCLVVPVYVFLLNERLGRVVGCVVISRAARNCLRKACCSEEFCGTVDSWRMKTGLVL